MPEQRRSALSAGDSPDYAVEMLKFLEDREPLAVFGETEDALRAAVAGLSDEQLRAPEPPGKWSVREVVAHLADVEFPLGFRYRMVVAQSGCSVPAMDQDSWVTGLDSNARDVGEAIDAFARVRAVNLRFLQRLPEDAWERFAIHDERGKETLRHMVRLYAAHDRYHLYQIDRIKNSTA